MTSTPDQTRTPAGVTRLPQQRRAAPVPTGPTGPTGPTVEGSLALAPVPVATTVPGADRTARRALGTRHVGPREAEVQAWAGRFAQAAVEVLTGRRPVTQLIRWTDVDVYADLERRAAVLAQARPHDVRSLPAVVQRVHVCLPDDGVAEASVTVRQGRRTRALALRVETHRGQWRCTVLRIL